MDSDVYRYFADTLLRAMVVLAVCVPLAIWKVVEIVLWILS